MSKITSQRSRETFYVLTGDWGGQVYMTIPASLLKISQDDLKKLLRIIDMVAWPGQRDGAGLSSIHSRQDFYPIMGGMGGGCCIRDQIWMHERLPWRMCHWAVYFAVGRIKKLPTRSKLTLWRDQDAWYKTPGPHLLKDAYDRLERFRAYRGVG